MPSHEIPADFHDSVVADLLAREEARQTQTLSLIASENHCSRGVRQACASVITDKYAEGYPKRRYYGGCEVADDIEDLARERACELFGVEHANVQPHSGTTANLAVLIALAGVGGRILGMQLNAGGHLSHGYPMSHTGKLFDSAHYGVEPQTGLIDYDEVAAMAREHRPRVLIAGASSYPRAIDFERMAAIATEVDARLMADIAHPAGLIAGRAMASPVPHADVVTMTTHKTLRGPRGGMVLCGDELAKEIDRAIFPGGQGGPLMHQIAGKAIAFGEALTDEFRGYAARVCANAEALVTELANRGCQIITGGTDSHMVLVDLRGRDVTGADVEGRAALAGISLNKNMVPNDPKPPRITSGIRVGTAAITSRGMGTAEMQTIAEVIVALIEGQEPADLKGRIDELCAAHPLP